MWPRPCRSSLMPLHPAPLDMKAADYEREAAAALELAHIVMRKERPDYGEAERQMSRAKKAIEYARQINNGTYKGEEY